MCFVRHGGVFVRVSPNRLQKVINYLRNEDDKNTQYSIEEKKNNDRNEETESHSISEEVYRDTATTQNVQQIRKALKADDRILYKVQNADEWTKAMVLGRAGKATGKNKCWYNIEDEVSKEKKSVNLDH